MSRHRPSTDPRGPCRPRAVVAVAAAALVLIGAATMVTPATLLVWNASASAPVGLYRRLPAAPPGVGDYVLVRIPESLRALADRRGYLPAAVPLVKRVAAVASATVCAAHDTITIDGEAVATRHERDRMGRILPRWEGCQRLADDTVFLLMVDVPDSFDGRYFGPVARAAIIERLAPLWTE